MRILMLAPEPCFEPRGTPFSVYHRARALGLLGHEVDLVTYPFGDAAELPGTRIYRTRPIPFVSRVKIGPSFAKLPLDALVFAKATGLLLQRRYDCIHTHEEAGVFGALLGWFFRVPHVYDMHSDLAEQMANSKFARFPFAVAAMRQMERLILRSASQVIVICPELQQAVSTLTPETSSILVENTSQDAVESAESIAPPADRAARLIQLRQQLDLPEGAGPTLVYTGTFEPYQGIDLVIESIPAVLASFPSARYVLVGGRPDQVAAAQAQARRLGIEAAVRLPGQRPPADMPLFSELADILLSPRSQGTNTPLKIYSYLHIGKPLLATNIRSHTQVLSPDVALLVEPTSNALAAGAIRLLGDETLRLRLAHNARALAMSKYSYDSFLSRTATAYHDIQPKWVLAQR